MCSHYDATEDEDRLKAHFDIDSLPLGLKSSLWPGYPGPFIRNSESGQREVMAGIFGMVAHWAPDTTGSRHTYNARAETVDKKPTFQAAWRLARHCVIPAEAIYEPDWRSGKAIATRITRADGKPMGIAGLWTGWKQPDGEILRSFTMLTVNADDHPFMRQFHKPQDEKRMVVILPESDYAAWLAAPAEDSRAFLRQFPAEALVAQQPNQDAR